jgi:molybdopterin-guanine dinucleotide biosynthesis protein A
VIAACDMPFIDEGVVRQLCELRNPFRFASVFRNPESGRIEPLFACYEPKSRTRLFEQHMEGNNSLSFFLEESRIEELTAPSSVVLQNINDAEGRQTRSAR